MTPLVLLCVLLAVPQQPDTAPLVSAPAADVVQLAPEAEEALRARAAAWWQAREIRDHQAMYDLYEPAYREEVPFADFLRESAVRTRYDLTFRRVVEVVAEQPVRVKVTIEVGGMLGRFGGPHAITPEDTWVDVDGEWYKVHEPFKPPFPVSPPQ